MTGSNTPYLWDPIWGQYYLYSCIQSHYARSKEKSKDPKTGYKKRPLPIVDEW